MLGRPRCGPSCLLPGHASAQRPSTGQPGGAARHTPTSRVSYGDWRGLATNAAWHPSVVRRAQTLDPTSHPSPTPEKKTGPQAPLARRALPTAGPSAHRPPPPRLPSSPRPPLSPQAEERPTAKTTPGCQCSSLHPILPPPHPSKPPPTLHLPPACRCEKRGRTSASASAAAPSSAMRSTDGRQRRVERAAAGRPRAGRMAAAAAPRRAGARPGRAAAVAKAAAMVPRGVGRRRVWAEGDGG